MREVVSRAHAGVPVLAICNGFQILTECGLLPGVLMANADLKSSAATVFLRVENPLTPFTHHYDDGDVIRVPVAHHDGNYFVDPSTYDDLVAHDQIAFRYCNPSGSPARTPIPTDRSTILPASSTASVPFWG